MTRFATSLLLSVLPLVLLVSHVKAEPIKIRTAGDLYNACQSSDERSLDICDAYIQGIRDFLEGNGWGAYSRTVSADEQQVMLPYAACNVPNVEHIRRSFLDWISARPPRRSGFAAMTVWVVISQNWPCLPDARRGLHQKS